MTYTLISSIGTGIYENGYRTTRYEFPGGEQYETRLFLDAILKTKYRDVKKIVLVGTKTSSWDVLIDETKPENEDLWLTVKDECCSPQGISDEKINEVEQYTEKNLGMPVKLKVHSPVLDETTAKSIFNVYNSISREILEGTKILFDITHGFRSMPILIYQALQFDSANDSVKDVEIIYGEYVKESKVSYVRNLTPYWELSEITQARNQFFIKLDGRSLAAKIRPYWNEGAKAIYNFSEVVSLNYSLQITEVLKTMATALKCDISKSPEWVKDVYEEIKNIYKQLKQDKTSRTLFEYAKFLESKALYTQAVIALEVCIETAVAEINGFTEEQFGDYEWWQSEDGGKKQLRDMRYQLDKQTSFAINDITNIRNAVAHGGSKDKFSGEFPTAAALKKILKDGKTAVLKFFETFCR